MNSAPASTPTPLQRAFWDAFIGIKPLDRNHSINAIMTPRKCESLQQIGIEVPPGSLYINGLVNTKLKYGIHFRLLDLREIYNHIELIVDLPSFFSFEEELDQIRSSQEEFITGLCQQQLTSPSDALSKLSMLVLPYGFEDELYDRDCFYNYTAPLLGRYIQEKLKDKRTKCLTQVPFDI